jgi:hypothetical protein
MKAWPEVAPAADSLRGRRRLAVGAPVHLEMRPEAGHPEQVDRVRGRERERSPQDVLTRDRDGDANMARMIRGYARKDGGRSWEPVRSQPARVPGWLTPRLDYFIAIGDPNAPSPNSTSAQAHHIWTLATTQARLGDAIPSSRHPAGPAETPNNPAAAVGLSVPPAPYGLHRVPG